MQAHADSRDKPDPACPKEVNLVCAHCRLQHRFTAVETLMHRAFHRTATSIAARLLFRQQRRAELA